MKYDPKDDDQLDREALLPAGKYPAVVISCEAKSSKAGNDMFALKLDVDGRHVFDYISPHFMHRKFKNFFKSANKLPLYLKGNMSEDDLLHLQVHCIIDIQAQEGYKPKNVVVDYIQDDSGSFVTDTSAKVADDDDLPF